MKWNSFGAYQRVEENSTDLLYIYIIHDFFVVHLSTWYINNENRKFVATYSATYIIRVP